MVHVGYTFWRGNRMLCIVNRKASMACENGREGERACLRLDGEFNFSIFCENLKFFQFSLLKCFIK